jgi:hypothetical protein
MWTLTRRTSGTWAWMSRRIAAVAWDGSVIGGESWGRAKSAGIVRALLGQLNSLKC